MVPAPGAAATWIIPGSAARAAATSGWRWRSIHLSQPMVTAGDAVNRPVASTACTATRPNASAERTAAAPLCGS